MDTILKKPEVIRDDMGRFDRHGRELSKTAKNRMNTGQIVEKQTVEITGQFKPGQSGNPAGRPKGALNKTTAALKEQILDALDKVGGAEYLAKLAIENSSAFASLLGKVLPSTLAVDDTSKDKLKVTFERVIVHPDGRKEIEGKTPKLIEHRVDDEQRNHDLDREADRAPEGSGDSH